MTAPFVMPEPGSRRWCDDPDGPQPIPPRKMPRPIVIVPRSEEAPRRRRIPPHGGGGATPRAAVPTSSQSGPVRSSAGVTRQKNAPAEGGVGEPGAGPGARAAEPSAAESKVRRRARPVAAPSGSPVPKRKGPTAKLLRWGDRELSTAAWAAQPDVKARGISHELIRKRLHDGWAIEDTLSEPPRRAKVLSVEERRRLDREKKARWRAKQRAGAT
jgi:hypothetical protein